MFETDHAKIKYQDAEDTQEASSETKSTPLCNIGLKRSVSGNGTWNKTTYYKKILLIIIT